MIPMKPVVGKTVRYDIDKGNGVVVTMEATVTMVYDDGTVDLKWERDGIIEGRALRTNIKR